jgi:hypothetical protein
MRQGTFVPRFVWVHLGKVLVHGPAELSRSRRSPFRESQTLKGRGLRQPPLHSGTVRCMLRLDRKAMTGIQVVTG